MSINEINIKIETLKEWEAIAAEASAMVESIKDEIKRHMDAQGLEELEAGTHIKVDLYGVSRLCLCEVFSRFYPEQLRTLQKLLHTLCGTPHHTIATWIKQPLRRYM